MKNKGFAISTLLYGVMAIAIIVLALLLTNMRSQVFLNQKLQDNLGEDLNKCALKEIRMQNCARYYSEEKCSRIISNFKTCIEDKNASTGGSGKSLTKFFSEIKKDLTPRIDPIGSQDEVGTNKEIFYYTGRSASNLKNFVQFEEHLGRIVSIDLRGNASMKVIFLTDENEGNLVFQSENAANVPSGKKPELEDEVPTGGPATFEAWPANSNIILWNNSNLAQYLNIEFIKKFNNPEKFKKRSIPVGSFPKTSASKLNDALFLPRGNELESDYSAYFYKFHEYKAETTVSSTSLVDVFNASTCDFKIIRTSDFGCLEASWLNNNFKTWSTTQVYKKSDGLTEYEMNEALKTGVNEIFLTDGRVAFKKQKNIKVYPTVVFSDIKVLSGVGTQDDPYIIE